MPGKRDARQSGAPGKRGHQAIGGAVTGGNAQIAEDQSEIIAFLSDPRSHDPVPARVERIDTHGAMVFLAGENAYKIKRAVHFSYMDFSTPARRRAACENEIRVNRENAPQIYLGTIAITREADGGLALGGSGETIEWAVHMRRFDENAGLDRLAGRGALSQDLLERLARSIAAAHERAPRRPNFDQGRSFAAILAQERDEFDAVPELFSPQRADELVAASRRALERLAASLDARAADGFVRQCHGDLHLANIVLIDGEPVLFDAIEFDDAIATVDVLYDLAFLLMDLDMRGMRAAANLVFNGYLKSAREDAHFDALAAMPLFLATRAAIRARVTASRMEVAGAAAGGDGGRRADMEAEARRYFDAASAYLAPDPPRLVAIGGLSGTGKTTLARRLAPFIGAAPGAVHMRSDVERKALFGIGETERLGPDGYAREITERVYRRLEEGAARVIRAGHGFVADAVYSTPQERSDIEAAARRAGAAFTGLWLEAGEQVLIERVKARRGDASDADAGVVRQQLERGTGAIAWKRIPAGGEIETVVKSALGALGFEPGT